MTVSAHRSSRSGRTAPAPAGRRRKAPLWAKLIVVLGALMLIGSGAAFAAVGSLLGKVDSSVHQQSLLGDAAPSFDGSTIRGPLNILLVGLDGGSRHNGPGGTDTIMIAHVPASHDRIYLVSLPRDTGVRIPAYAKSGFPGGSAKINAAFVYGSNHGGGVPGGFELLALTIKKNYGISFNAGAIVDFTGFEKIVQQLGGVTMYVDETTYSIHHGYINNDPKQHAAPYHINPDTGVPTCPRGFTFDSTPDKCTLPGVKEVVYRKGWQHLSPYDALDFMRCRDGLVGTDYGRQRHQQQLIRAVLQQSYQQGLSDPFKLSGFIQAIGSAFTFDGGGIPMNDWIFTLKGIGPDAMTTIKTNGGQYVRYTGSDIPGSVQGLNSDSLALLQAVRADKGAADDHVGAFVAAHPSWNANTAAAPSAKSSATPSPTVH
ncbi:LCP family protein [Hamadaea tsunoensis]|uniref:LCP family protein n=1 Tax=Hamadaea tsunoensis TaxID=53368 RepID=UPI000418DB17|nr:LCP family protein [Hamadaea tsunoensis]